MKYMVMECHTSYVILLDEESRFLKAANMNYEVGQLVEDPVLMLENVKPPRTGFIPVLRAGIVAVAACLFLMFSAGYYQNHMKVYASIYLTINPQIQMNLNRKGTVVELSGMNEDGKVLLEGYQGKGKDKVTVSDELIDRAIDMGFLSEGGRVSFSIDAPDEMIFEEYGVELREQVSEYISEKITVTIEITNEKVNPTLPENKAPGETDYGTHYDDTDYGPENDGVKDSQEDDTDYGPNNDGITDYQEDDTDYGPENDGITDYSADNTDDGLSDYQDDSGDDAGDRADDNEKGEND